MTSGREPSAETASTSPILAKMLRVEWLGQTLASVCWIVSVFVYGVSELGDWLQLAAATAWFVANIAALQPNSSTEKTR